MCFLKLQKTILAPKKKEKKEQKTILAPKKKGKKEKERKKFLNLFYVSFKMNKSKEF